MMCPLFKSDCGNDCQWLVQDKSKGGKQCVVVVLARELVAMRLEQRGTGPQ